MWEKYEKKTIAVKPWEYVTVTDPCYDRDIRSQTDVKLPEGEYECYYDESDEGCWGVRISRIAIVKKGCGFKLDSEVYSTHNVGTAPVDAGLCGFFINKPDYDDEAWAKFCDDLEEIDKDGCKNVYHTAEGFFTSSGYGDGEYEVLTLEDHHGVFGLMVIFIEDEEDWEDEDEEDEEDEDEE